MQRLEGCRMHNFEFPSVSWIDFAWSNKGDFLRDLPGHKSSFSSDFLVDVCVSSCMSVGVCMCCVCVCVGCDSVCMVLRVWFSMYVFVCCFLQDYICVLAQMYLCKYICTCMYIYTPVSMPGQTSQPVSLPVWTCNYVRVFGQAISCVQQRMARFVKYK